LPTDEELNQWKDQCEISFSDKNFYKKSENFEYTDKVPVYVLLGKENCLLASLLVTLGGNEK